MSNTKITITDEQITALAAEADKAGDWNQVALCLRALGSVRYGQHGSIFAVTVESRRTARAECAELIADAAAQAEHTAADAALLAARTMQGRHVTLTWREAGYSSAFACARAMVGDTGNDDLDAAAAAIVADTLTEEMGS